MFSSKESIFYRKHSCWESITFATWGSWVRIPSSPPRIFRQVGKPACIFYPLGKGDTNPRPLFVQVINSRRIGAIFLNGRRRSLLILGFRIIISLPYSQPLQVCLYLQARRRFEIDLTFNRGLSCNSYCRLFAQKCC